MERSLAERNDVLMRARLEFKSPFIIGGIKPVPNYIETLDYIPGNVLRAAFARYILNNCPCFSQNEVAIINGEKRKNWVYFRDKQECVNCRLKSLCVSFSKVKFSFFYPEGTDVIPLTTMRCKMKPEHRLIDVLIEKRECPDCLADGISDARVESITGYLKYNDIYKVNKTLLTRTAVDKYTGTAKDGMLYSIEAITGTHDGGSIIYEGQVEGIPDEAMSMIEELRVGKYTSVGFGKCSISFDNERYDEEKPADEDLVKKLQLFNKKYKDYNEIKDNNNYIAIKFTADTKLDFRGLDGGKTSLSGYINKDYLKDIWLNSMNSEKINPQGYRIDKVYAEVFNFRGYDTSKIGDVREEPVHMAQKGSVIVFKTEKSFSEITNDFESIDGFGLDVANGFGRFAFHFGLEVY